MLREDMPFLYGLIDYAVKGIIPFNTPGHKQGRGAHPTFKRAMESGLDLDVSDVLESEEYGHSWVQALKGAQNLAAETFGARHTRFLVNGTTSGIHTMFLAARALGFSRIVMPRFSHLSAYSGLALSGLEPVFLRGSVLEGWNLPLPPEGDEYIRSAGEKDLLFSTYPNYYGIGADLTPLADLAGKRGSYLLVDEAHGPHFAFHPRLPDPALTKGADVSVQSTHKVLAALSGASMLHLGERFKAEYVDTALNILQTTSPSALLLASLDAARAQMAGQGRRLWQKALELADTLKERIIQDVGLNVLDGTQLPEGFCHDPARMVINTAQVGITGLKAAALLREKGLQVEMADPWNIVLIITWADNTRTIKLLLNALKDLVAAAAKGRNKRITTSLDLLPVPKRVISYRQAAFSPAQAVGFSDCLGRVCAELICPYPPGVPLISPGELLDEQVLECLKKVKRNAFEVRGAADPSLETIRVIG
jgi:arginine decarboxylase